MSFEDLKKKINDVEKGAKCLQEYFCDDLKFSDMLVLLSNFIKSIEQAKSENEQRRLREERSAKQEQERLKKGNNQSYMHYNFCFITVGKFFLVAALHNKRSVEIVCDENSNLVESLLMQIQEGDIKPRAEGGKEKARRNSRKSLHQIFADQNRERTPSSPLLVVK